MAVNQMKSRLQSLGLVDRALAAMSDDELSAAVEALDDDHREALEQVVGGGADDADTTLTPTAIRAAAAKGRMDGGLEAVAMVVGDAALNDCIDKLGEHSDNPTSEQLGEVLPGIVERHGVAVTRVMLASTVAGEATASPIIRDILKRDETLALPKAADVRIVPELSSTDEPDAEREAVKAKRAEAKAAKKEAARLRREQSARDRNRS